MMKYLNRNIKIFFVIISFVYSTGINLEIVENISNNFVIERSDKQHIIKSIEFNSYNGVGSYYVVNLRPSGFILVAASKNIIPVLGYSFTNNFNQFDLPPQLNQILESYRNHIDYIISNNITPDILVPNLWEKYSNHIDRDENFREIEPLISANWNQGGQWNDMCPGNTLVGCVAVAMGQVMYYWQNPTQGDGYTAYYHQQYGPISINFEDYIYNFENMQDNNATQASQLLLYHAGVAVHMNYSHSGSGAAVCWEGPSAEDALKNHFNYVENSGCHTKINYDESGWLALIEDQLNRGWPIIYRAYGENDGPGHAWNIDGYQEGGYLHCNWGWGGSSNGYYYFNSLNVGGLNFIESQAALINLFPQGINNPIALFEFEFDEMNVNFIDLSSMVNENQIISWNWNFGDGSISNSQSPVHYYENYGEYQVSLIVRDEYGLDSFPYIENLNILDLSCDLNDDLLVNVLDIVYLIELILENSTIFQQNADINDDGELSILDVVILVNTILNT